VEVKEFFATIIAVILAGLIVIIPVLFGIWLIKILLQAIF